MGILFAVLILIFYGKTTTHTIHQRRRGFWKEEEAYHAPPSPFVFVYSFSVFRYKSLDLKKLFSTKRHFSRAILRWRRPFILAFHSSWCQNQHRNRLFNDNIMIQSSFGPFLTTLNYFGSKRCDLYSWNPTYYS